MKFFLVYKNNGLYDMAIDDQEALFEPIDLQDDFVQQSEPTEVLPPLTPTPLFPIEPDKNESQSRSLTASPFLVPTKPYRPFSTEPIPEVKPLEDPIILNPQFHDEFIKGLEDYLPKTKFKLPVSEKYDPNYGIEKKEVSSNLNKEFYEDKTSESAVDYSQTYSAEEINQMKQARMDIDLSKIEESNYSAQEFKTEVVISKESVDFKSTTSKSVDFASVTSKCYEESINKESLKCENAKEFVETKTTDENISKLEEIKKTAEVFVDEIIEQAKTVAGYIKDELEVDSKMEMKTEKTENIVDSETKTENVHESVSSLKQKYEDQMTKDVAISQTKQDVVEVTEAGKVKNIASSFEKETDTKSNIKSDKKLEAKQKHTSFTESEKAQGSYTTTTQSKTSTEHQKSLNEQKAYVLGLKTIPNIRGTIISSKHFDMLLKTFFIHLTDVMVALSRFILAEPAFTTEKLDSNVENNFTREFITKEQIITKHDEEIHVDSNNETIKDRHERQFESINESELTDTESEMQRKDKKKESNIKMALKSSETSEEVAHNMEAVISEFQIKKGIEDIHEDDVAMTEQTSNMTEMLDSENVLKTETRSESKFIADTSMTKSEVNSKHHHEEQQEMRTETGAKNTYIAIVESHVYTNRDSTMEMAIKSADLSRKSSVEEIISKETEAFREAVETAQIEEKEEIAQVEQKVEKVQIEEIMETTQVEENVQISQVEETQPVVSFEEEISNITTIVEESMQEENTNENLKRVSVVDEIQGSQNVTQNASVSIEEVVEKLESQILSSAEEQTVSHEEQSKTIESENAELCLKKYQYGTGATETQQISEQIISEQQTLIKQEQTTISKQEQSFISKELTETQTTHKYDNTKLSLDLKPEKPKKHPSTTASTPSTIDTPTPGTIPPTPLTDEYIFRLEAPMPKNRGTPTPIPEKPIEPEEHEDPHIVKKRMVPHIDTNIERIVYDPPLLTPDVGSGMIFEERPFQDRPVSREEIKEIERTSSLLASAIDQTIKSIEEYKEQAGMESNKAMESISPPLLDVNTTNITNTANSEAAVPLTPNIYSGTVQEAKTIVYSQPAIDIKKSSFTQAQESINISSEIDMTTTSEMNTTSEINGFRSVKFMPDSEQTPDVCKIEGTMKSLNEESIKMTKTEEVISTVDKSVENTSMPTYRPVHFDPSEFKSAVSHTHFESLQETQIKTESTTTKTLSGTHLGIVDSLEEQIMDSDTAKELGKPGISEEKIAELISGEAEMLREAHVMGLKRVLNAHMHKTDDENSSVDFMKIKPSIDGLRDSEVLKALNEELIQKKVEEKKKEEKDKGTTFLQKPKRPVPKAKHGYHGWLPEYENLGEPYKVKIVKQPKPKVAPDYKPEVFETGPLPWEERAANEPPPPPVLPEDPILIPEEGPQFLEAVDPLPESEVPDLEDTGIQLPPEEPVTEQDPSQPSEPAEDHQPEVFDLEKVIEETEQILLEDMEEAKIAEQLMSDVQGMVDPKATLEQQLSQMRAQLAALAQLPCVIQQTLDLVTKQLTQLTQQGATEVVTESKTVVETTETVEVTEKLEKLEETKEEREEFIQHQHVEEKTTESNGQEQVVQDVKQDTTQESTTECCMKQETKECSMKQEKECSMKQETKECTMKQEKECSMKQEIRESKEKVRRETDEIMDEQRRIERSKKDLIEQLQQEHESRQLKQRPTPRVGKPKPVFGPLTPQERPLVLPGGRKWRKPADAYNEQFIAETLQAQAEIISGKTMGSTFESNRLPYDESINFKKYEKPPISLDHLKESDVYKMVHNMDQGPQRRVEMMTTAIAESDYREKCRAATPAVEKISR